MKVAFIHYHLKTGGVTTVLRHQLAALTGSGEVLVVSSGPPTDPIGAAVATVPDLAYDTEGGGREPAGATADAVEAAIYARWPQGCDLIHVHNPTLAKNCQLLSVLQHLRRRGFRLLLQLHDFAEDGRPHLYPPQPYPEDCHYAVLNSRDYGNLQKAGLLREGLHLLPNMIVPQAEPEPTADVGAPLQVLYPVRAIRRKNIGEAALLSCFFPSDCRLAVTLPPNSPQDRTVHADWRAFARRVGLNMAFDVGVGQDFGALLATARFILTTSVMEGFGFSFLEPWTAAKLVWGRRLPDICRDFEQNGISLSHLYDRLTVPLAWINPALFEARWKESVRAACERFGTTLPPTEVTAAFRHITRNGQVDFGLLDETAQQHVITRIHADPGERRRLADLNAFLLDPGRIPDAPELVRRNRAAVLNRYNRAVYRNHLVDTYRRVIETPVRHRVDKRALLSAFLDLKTFSLLKWGRYVR